MTRQRTQAARRSTILAAAALLPALAAAAHGQNGDASKSNIKILKDERSTFMAAGMLRVDQVPGADHLFAILPVPGVNWEFQVWVEGYWKDWGLSDLNLALQGNHLHGPHHEKDDVDIDPNPLDLIDVGSTRIGKVDLQFKDWDKAEWISVSHTVEHETTGKKAHTDWYGIRWKPSALESDGSDPAIPLVAGASSIAAKHWGVGESGFPDWLTSQYETYGSTEKAGSTTSFDPATGTLTLVVGAVDIADREGGRTLSVEPRFTEDPILGVRTQVIELRLFGYDADRGEYVFTGGELYAENPETALRIGGSLGEFRISSTLPGERMGAYGGFRPLVVVDNAEPDESPSLWAESFICHGWFGEGRSDEEWEATLQPALTLTTPLDLIEATNGFTLAADLPATILVTMAARPGCPADFNGDGRVDTRDVLNFLNAWVAGCGGAGGGGGDD